MPCETCLPWSQSSNDRRKTPTGTTHVLLGVAENNRRVGNATYINAIGLFVLIHFWFPCSFTWCCSWYGLFIFSILYNWYCYLFNLFPPQKLAAKLIKIYTNAIHQVCHKWWWSCRKDQSPHLIHNKQISYRIRSDRMCIIIFCLRILLVFVISNILSRTCTSRRNTTLFSRLHGSIA